MDTKEALDREKLRQMKLANDELERQLLRTHEVETMWTGWLAEWRTSMEAIPAQLASKQKFSAAQMAAVRRALDGMKKDLEAYSKRMGRAKPLAGRRKLQTAKPSEVVPKAAVKKPRPVRQTKVMKKAILDRERAG